MTTLSLAPTLREPPADGRQPPAAADASPIVQVRDLTMVYDQDAGPVLDAVSLDVRRGEIHGIIGRSGAGKSTLVRCLNRLVVPTRGEITVCGHDVPRLDGPALRRARRDIGMIFQHFSLMSARTVAGNVAFPLEVAGLPKDQIRKRIAALLDLVGLSNKADAYPAELSGGQKQRVGIARALALDPQVLLSDEATSALDPETTEQILALLKDINRRLGLTIVLITHEMEVVRAIASHVTVLDHGRVVESGPTFDVFAFPRSAISRTFLSAIVAHDLPHEVAARLQSRPGGDTDPVLRLLLTGDAALAPVTAEIFERFGIRASILHGRVDYIQDRPLGVLSLLLPGAGDRIPAVLGYFAQLGLHGEVVGHAVRSSAAGAHRAAS